MKSEAVIVVVLIVAAVAFMFINHVEAQLEKPGKEKLVIIWSTADREVALNMVFMYTSNLKNLDGGMMLPWLYGVHPPNFPMGV